jgi:hypothetical protein
MDKYQRLQGEAYKSKHVAVCSNNIKQYPTVHVVVKLHITESVQNVMLWYKDKFFSVFLYSNMFIIRHIHPVRDVYHSE